MDQYHVYITMEETGVQTKGSWLGLEGHCIADSLPQNLMLAPPRSSHLYAQPDGGKGWSLLSPSSMAALNEAERYENKLCGTR